MNAFCPLKPKKTNEILPENLESSAFFQSAWKQISTWNTSVKYILSTQPRQKCIFIHEYELGYSRWKHNILYEKNLSI